MSFSNASLQTNDLPRSVASPVPKYDSQGKPAGLYVYGVEQARWQEQLDRDRARSAANAQFDAMSDGYLATAESQRAAEASAKRRTFLAGADVAESMGQLTAATQLRYDEQRTPESAYVENLF